MNLRHGALPLFTLASLACLAACGSPPPVAPAPPAPDVKVPVAKEPPIDVSPVPEPPNLVVVGRVKKPEAIIKTAATWSHLPLPGGKELLREMNETLADIVDFSQPIDGAVGVTLSRNSVDPDPVFSVSVKSFDAAKAALTSRYKMLPVTNGGLKIFGLLDKPNHAETRDGEDGDDDRDACVLAHAATGAKLICGTSNAVDNLAPYMARTLPRESWPADVHIEIRPEPIRAPLSAMRSMLPALARNMFGSNSQAVRELLDASVGEAVDVVEDAQKLTIDAMLDDNGAKATTRFDFQSNKSVLARALTDTSRAEPAPAAFWHLPSETDTAIFLRGSDPKLYDHPREMLANLLGEGLDDSQLPAAEKKAVHDLIADKMLRLFSNGGTGVYGKGFDQAALDKALKARTSLKADDYTGDRAAQRAIAEQVIGWHLYQVSDPVEKVGPILKDWSALWNRPAFAKWMEEHNHSTKKDTPKLKITPMPAGVTLPKDTVHLEVSIPMSDAYQPYVPPPPSPRGGPPAKPPAQPKPIPQKPIIVHVFAVPDGTATWVAIGLDGKLVANKVAQSLATAPDTNSLGKAASAQGIELLKEPKINGGALATLRGFMVLSAMEAGRAGDKDGSAYESLAALPNKGATPILFMGKAEGPSANAKVGSSVGQTVITRQAIEDIVKLAFVRK